MVNLVKKHTKNTLKNTHRFSPLCYCVIRLARHHIKGPSWQWDDQVEDIDTRTIGSVHHSWGKRPRSLVGHPHAGMMSQLARAHHAQ